MLSEEEPETGSAMRLARVVLPLVAVAVALIGLTVLIWNMAHDRTTVKHEQPPLPVVVLTPPPPPPPPPPPKEQPPEPQRAETVPSPQPAAQPKAAPAQPQSLQINGTPQAGGDSFGLQAGTGNGGTVGGNGTGGGGTGGGGFAESAFRQYISNTIQDAVQKDDRVTRSVFSLNVRLWIDSAGKITNANIFKSSGDAALDRQVVAVLLGMRRFDQPPPASMTFPQKVTIRGRRA